MRITKRIEFDYGHRIPFHSSKCRSPHGHRAVVDITLEGGVKPIRGQSDDGMVLDFSEVKKLVMEQIHDIWDHAFLIWEQDRPLIDFLLGNKDWKIVPLEFIPTAENLSQHIFNILSTQYNKKYGDDLVLRQVRFYETPNSWADATQQISSFWRR